MESKRPKFFFLSIIIFFSTTLFGGCNSLDLESKWRDRDITIDGVDTEWQDSSLYYDAETRTLVGMANDEDHLFILLSSSHRGVQRLLLRLGLIVWFDQEGGTEKSFGVHFPIGRQDNGMPRKERAIGEDPDDIQKMLQEPLDTLELLGPDKGERNLVKVFDARRNGIDVKMAESEGNLVYELKVRLSRSDQMPYAVRTDVAETIGVGFEMGKIDSKTMRARTGEPLAQRIKIGGELLTLSRGCGVAGPGRGDQMYEPFELWMTVRLASKTPEVE